MIYFAKEKSMIHDDRNIIGPLGLGYVKIFVPSGQCFWYPIPETNSKRTWKWIVGIRSLPFGMANFQVRTVSFREGNLISSKWISTSQWRVSSLTQMNTWAAWMTIFPKKTSFKGRNKVGGGSLQNQLEKLFNLNSSSLKYWWNLSVLSTNHYSSLFYYLRLYPKTHTNCTCHPFEMKTFFVQGPSGAKPLPGRCLWRKLVDLRHLNWSEGPPRKTRKLTHGKRRQGPSSCKGLKRVVSKGKTNSPPHLVGLLEGWYRTQSLFHLGSCTDVLD